MNIIEAVKSGKRFRRVQIDQVTRFGDWITSYPPKFDRYHLTPEDILATDWEVEERKIEITESEFNEAVESVCETFADEKFMEKLKKRLFDKHVK